MSRKSHGAADFLMIFFLSNRFGLEGLVTFKRENEYDAETYEIAVPVDGTSSSNGGKSVRIGVFDKVLVEISVEKVRYIQGVVPAAFNYCRFRNANVFFLDACSSFTGQEHTAWTGYDGSDRTS